MPTYHTKTQAVRAEQIPFDCTIDIDGKAAQATKGDYLVYEESTRTIVTKNLFERDHVPYDESDEKKVKDLERLVQQLRAEISALKSPFRRSSYSLGSTVQTISAEDHGPPFDPREVTWRAGAGG